MNESRCRIRRAAGWISLLLALTMLPLAPVPAQVNDTTSPSIETATARDDALESYLHRMQLRDLLIDHYQSRLAASRDLATRQKIAQRLFELLSRKLNSDNAGFEEASNAWDALAAEFPDVVDDATRIAIAFGHYRRARAALDNWIWNGEPAGARADIQQQLADLIQRTRPLTQVPETSPDSRTGTPSETGRSEPETGRSEPETGQSEPETGQSEPGLVLGDEPTTETPPATGTPIPPLQNETVMQARFLLAWSLYYLALIDQDEATRNDRLMRAGEIFSELLRIPADTRLTELRPQWFALDSAWLCRVLTGYGMVAQATGDNATSQYCFNLLGNPRVPSTIRQHQRVFQFQAVFTAGQIAQARRLAHQLSERDRGAVLDAGLWRTVAMAGLGGRVFPGFQHEYDGMSLIGLAGLAKQHDWSSIDLLFAEYDREVVGTGFMADWMEGYRRLRAATNHAANPRDAIELLQQAVAGASGNNPGITAEQQFELRARCRYHLGFALYLSGRYEPAIEQFRQATAVLQRTDPSIAEHCCWMNCQALERLASVDPVWQSSLLAAVQDFQSRFPNSDRVNDLQFLEILIRAGGQQPDETIQALRAIPAGDPNFTRARFELCRLAHQQWRESSLAGELRQRLAEQVVEAANVFGTSNRNSYEIESSAQQTRVSLLAADVLVHSESPDIAAADRWLVRCADTVDLAETSPDLASDYYYLTLTIASQLGQVDRQQAASHWLAENAVRPEHRRAGLSGLAKSIDDQLENFAGNAQPAERRADLIRQAIELYERILATEVNRADSAKDPETIRALFRVASLQLEIGQTIAAYDRFQKLHQIDPLRLDWLTGLARAATASRKWSKAAEYWQIIAGGTTPGNNDWLEAKYNLVICLIETDSGAAANQVLTQTRLLVPHMPDSWSGKFDRLRSRLQQ